MGRLRLMHSFSCRPMAIDCYGVDRLSKLVGGVWFSALSVAYALRSGADIVLHTDTLGASLLGHLPYSEIHLTLDSMPDDIHPRFWAAGKIFALQAEEPGTVHIDGDVFIKRASLVDDIAAPGWDFIAQSVEDESSRHCYEMEVPVFAPDAGACHSRGFHFETYGAYNTGVIGFRDRALRDEFCSTYVTLAKHFSRLSRRMLDENPVQTPDIMLEQRFVMQLCARHGSRVKLVLPHYGLWGDTAAAIGYQHIVTAAKYNLVGKVKETLARVSPEIHQSTLKLCQNL